MNAREFRRAWFIALSCGFVLGLIVGTFATRALLHGAR